jgi:hypothetical protein
VNRLRVRVPAPVRRAAAFEAALWRSSAQWLLRRRPGAGPQDREFSHRGVVLAPVLVLLAVAVLEVVVLELIIPWRPLRAVLLVLGLWGVAFVLGLLAAMTVRPHLVGPAGIRVRYGPDWEALLPWAAVADVRAVRRSREGRGVQRDGDALHVVVGDQTTVEITLAQPLALRPPRGDEAEVARVTLYADDPRGFAAAVREHRAAATGLVNPASRRT